MSNCIDRVAALLIPEGCSCQAMKWLQCLMRSVLFGVKSLKGLSATI